MGQLAAAGNLDHRADGVSSRGAQARGEKNQVGSGSRHCRGRLDVVAGRAKQSEPILPDPSRVVQDVHDREVPPCGLPRPI